MILIDGARYELWSPKEESELEAIVREHSKDIWGPNSLYLESSKLRTEAGVGSRPDAFVLLVDGSPECNIVEVELSSHPLYEHVVAQVIKFGSGLANPGTQRKLVNLIYNGLNANVSLAGQVKRITRSADLHKFLSDLLARPPVLTIVIEEKTRLLDEAVQQLPSHLFGAVKVVELRTFCREGCGLLAHAHLFEPQWQTSGVRGSTAVRDIPAGQRLSEGMPRGCTGVTAGDFNHLGAGIFALGSDSTIKLDANRRMRAVEEEMRRYLLWNKNIGAFYWSLRKKAGLLNTATLV